MTEPKDLTSFSEKVRPSLREELQQVISQAGDHNSPELLEMITYQLGWTGENAGSKAEGKQLRAVTTLLACEAAGGDWQIALPAAAAVELLHNFSLIHDDIEDLGETRRGRPSVWKIWGKAQAINTGDAMFALANISILNLADSVSTKAALQAGALFHATCLRLTQGQHLDISFENRDEVELDTYWKMVGGKTAALLAFCLQVGALAAGADLEIQAHYRDFGHYLGMAFQVQDDILGIWGVEEQTGKSITDDLVTRKKTLPVIYGLAQKKTFYQIWTEQDITAENAVQLAEILQAEGGRAYAQSAADRLTDLALAALDKAQPADQAGEILRTLAQNLLQRSN
ncbi:MAG: polyprenyl synthetase family protein [Anaerolineales bacterium]